MEIDKLKLFTTEEDIKNYAKINGYGDKGTTNLVNQWKELKTNNTEKKVKKGSKKFGIFNEETIAIKDED